MLLNHTAYMSGILCHLECMPIFVLIAIVGWRIVIMMVRLYLDGDSSNHDNSSYLKRHS